MTSEEDFSDLYSLVFLPVSFPPPSTNSGDMFNGGGGTEDLFQQLSSDLGLPDLMEEASVGQSGSLLEQLMNDSEIMQDEDSLFSQVNSAQCELTI